jgi:Abnormal spindle-like microcephaly-assoc'd, ASPM-SPD-2-Hydin
MSLAIAVFLMSAATVASSTQNKTLTSTTVNIWYGGVPLGQTATHTVTLTNGGSGSVTISKLTRTDPNFSTNLNLPVTLAAGQSMQFVAMFTPTFVGHINAALIFTSSATNSPLHIFVHGGGKNSSSGSLVPSAASLSFSGVQVGSSQTLPETITNNGGTNVTVSSISVKNSQFTFTAPGLPLALAAGHSMTLNVTFTPTTSNTTSGSLTVASSVPNLQVPLSGATGATGSLSVTPGALNFGQVAVGSKVNKTGTLSASGASVVVSAASVSSSEYSLTGLSFPVTVAAGKSVPFTATFAPQSSGAASANFTFTGNTSTATEALSGTGTAAGTHSVGLSWQASSSSVDGYNIYRAGASSGPFSKLNSSSDDNTSYTDSTVQSGNTYFYVTTAVGTDGVESAYSNQVKAVIP